MNKRIEPDPGENKRTSFVQVCGYCAARLEVSVTSRSDSEARAQYACPECSKGYTLHGASAPSVRVLEGRGDDKADPYAETIF